VTLLRKYATIYSVKRFGMYQTLIPNLS